MSKQRALDCIRRGDWYGFYKTRTWRTRKAEVLDADRHECQHCKAKGLYARATDVHHVNKIRERPDLALEMWRTDTDGTKSRNLISLCRRCHLEADGQTISTSDGGRKDYPEYW
jgi:5-methylcytosine-specific restriction endonuclease McrA